MEIIMGAMAELYLGASVSGSRYCECRLAVTLSWFTGTPGNNRAIVNAIPNTCAVLTITSHNVCCEEGLHSKWNHESVFKLFASSSFTISCSPASKNLELACLHVTELLLHSFGAVCLSLWCHGSGHVQSLPLACQEQLVVDCV